MTEETVAKDRTSLSAEVNVEQLEPLLTSTQAPPLQSEYVSDSEAERSSGASQHRASPSSVSPLQQSGTTKDAHTSPTHTAELMLAGGLPKNRRRPGSASDNQRVTMTGTVTRGKDVGQPVEVQLELTETEFLRLTSREPPTKGDHKFRCDRSNGPHIVLWSVLCIPVAMAISISISFYNGSMTWYNLFIYFSEEKTFFHKLTLCPMIILSFPVTVGVSSFIISLIALVMQLSWSWPRWLAEIRDGEKGFYGWFCGKVGLPCCSPYQIVVLDSGSK